MDIVRLVEQCKSGDKDAFGQLYQIYLPAMRKIVAYYIHNNDTVCDILHDGFLIAFSSINSLENNTRIESWLTSVMKNLALRYLKEEISHLSVPLSDEYLQDISDTSDNANRLTWEDLEKIINKLPEGYGKVFRLAVLDGLSHKEISKLLGIAPHSSSSQLSHAKAMLRRLINEYRLGIGALSLIAIAILILTKLPRNNEALQQSPETNDNNTLPPIATADDSITERNTCPDNQPSRPIIIRQTAQQPISKDILAEVAEKTDTQPTAVNDSILNDTITLLNAIPNRNTLIARKKESGSNLSKPSDWSLTLAYSGNIGQKETNRFMMPNPDIPSIEGPAGDIEVTEKTHHHMPISIILSVNKAINNRLSFETGIRYTYLRSDILSESELATTEISRHIHYVGLPLKFNYLLFEHNGVSLYGHGGGALDIPVYNSQSVISEQYPEWMDKTPVERHIHVPLQWSVETGIGVQYHITPSLSIYAEPSLRYYFNPGSDIKTIRQEKPFEFTIPIGIRLKW